MRNTTFCIVWLCFALLVGIKSANAGDNKLSRPELFSVEIQDTTKKVQLDAEMRQQIKQVKAEVDTINGQLKAKNMDAKLKLSVDTSGHKAIDISDEGIYISFGADHKNNKEKKTKQFKTQILGLDIGINTLLYNNDLSLPTSLKPLEHSMGINNVVIHLIRQGVNIYKHNVYFVYGIALDLNNYKFKNNYTIQPDVDSFVAVEQNIRFSKNKLAADFVTVPVMLHFETNPHKPSKSLDIGIGGFAGLLYSSRTKQISEEQGFRKTYDDFNLKKYRYGVSAQFGFSVLNFYVNYALSEMFEKGRGPKLAPINFGVVLNGFSWNRG